MFDIFGWPKSGKQHLPVLGYTVAQSEYDAALNEVEQWKGEWLKSQKKLTALEGEVVSIRKSLLSFGSMDSFGGETDSTVQLAKNVREQLDESTKTIKRLSMEAEQLQDKLDGSENVKLAYQLAQANETIEVWKDRAQHWKEEAEKKPAPRRKKMQDAS